jgi:hypothetical protein
MFALVVEIADDDNDAYPVSKRCLYCCKGLLAG